MRIRIVENRASLPLVGSVVDWPDSAARSLLANGLAEEVGARARSRKPKRPKPMRMARAPAGRPQREGDEDGDQS